MRWGSGRRNSASASRWAPNRVRCSVSCCAKAWCSRCPASPLGLALAALLGRTLASFLYGIGAYDPAVLIGVPVVLLLVAIVASLIPAQRAVRVDPMRTLRSE